MMMMTPSYYYNSSVSNRRRSLSSCLSLFYSLSNIIIVACWMMMVLFLPLLSEGWTSSPQNYHHHHQQQQQQHNGLFLSSKIGLLFGQRQHYPSSSPYYLSRRLMSSSSLSSSSSSSSDLDSTAKSNNNNNVMGGVSEFENWFVSIKNAKCNNDIKHEQFGNNNLRGLTCDGDDISAASNNNNNIMTVPKSIVLSSDFTQSDWDAKLATQLWSELRKGGKSSPIWGYIQLLTKGVGASDNNNGIPPSTAPDSIRHWTEEQKSVLSKTESGKRLLGLLKQQNDIWKNKYNESIQNNQMTWEQFVWSMEVVHSRAFCGGDFGLAASNSVIPPIVATAGPAISAIAGLIYYIPFHGQNDMVLIVLAIIGILPALINLLLSGQGSSNNEVAVLLPLIDSANHLEEADSTIEYNPLGDVFTLSIGNNCVVVEDSSKPQLYISYGKKKDTELLLNYGFLPGINMDGNNSNDVDDDENERRLNLAKAFIERN